MKFKITEPTFFLHQERKPGETLEHPVGPFRYEPGAGGLKRTAQFDVIDELNELTDRVVARRVVEKMQREGTLPPALMTTRDELKKKRLQAMGVVSGEMQASSAMYDRIIETGGKVVEARETAETAHMDALQEQIADLTEMAEEMGEFAQAVPTSGGSSGAKPPSVTAAPAATTAKPSTGSAALAVLNAAQPNPKMWDEAAIGDNGAPSSDGDSQESHGDTKNSAADEGIPDSAAAVEK